MNSEQKNKNRNRNKIQSIFNVCSESKVPASYKVLNPPQTNKNLEETIKDKVSPLLEQTMEEQWGITIPKLGSDLSDKLNSPQLDIYIPANLTFSKAKKVFQKEFLRRELRLHRGNISQLAKLLGLDRRSVHRVIKSMDIDVEELRGSNESEENYQEALVDKTIRSTLEHYKEIIHPQKMEKFYQEVPKLSKSIAKFLPRKELSWKEAEREFEKQFFQHVLEDCGNDFSAAAERIKIRVETLQRKMKKLGLKS